MMYHGTQPSLINSPGVLHEAGINADLKKYIPTCFTYHIAYKKTHTP